MLICHFHDFYLSFLALVILAIRLPGRLRRNSDNERITELSDECSDKSDS
jgi:hypothetical protein